MLKLKPMDARKRRKIANAIRKAEAAKCSQSNPRGHGSFWENLVRLLGERDARVAMMNLEWADPNFAPPLKK